MAIKRISDLSSILCVGTSNSSGAISCLTIQDGIIRDVLGASNGNINIDKTKDNDKETYKLKETLFEVSWPYGEATSGYTNFESRSITYEALSGYITHNILHETYTFAGNKKFTDSISVGKNLSVNGSVCLGNSNDDTTGDIIDVKGKKLSITATSAYNNIGKLSTTISSGLDVKYNNIDISGNGDKLNICAKTISVKTADNDVSGFFDVRGYNTNISASDHIKLLTRGTILSTQCNNNNSGGIFLSGHNIGISFTNSFTICCDSDPVLTISKNNTNNNVEVKFDKSSQVNPINGYINHALWS